VHVRRSGRAGAAPPAFRSTVASGTDRRPKNPAIPHMVLPRSTTDRNTVPCGRASVRCRSRAWRARVRPRRKRARKPDRRVIAPVRRRAQPVSRGATIEPVDAVLDRFGDRADGRPDTTGTAQAIACMIACGTPPRRRRATRRGRARLNHGATSSCCPTKRIAPPSPSVATGHRGALGTVRRRRRPLSTVPTRLVAGERFEQVLVAFQSRSVATMPSVGCCGSPSLARAADGSPGANRQVDAGRNRRLCARANPVLALELAAAVPRRRDDMRGPLRVEPACRRAVTDRRRHVRVRNDRCEQAKRVQARAASQVR